MSSLAEHLDCGIFCTAFLFTAQAGERMEKKNLMLNYPCPATSPFTPPSPSTPPSPNIFSFIHRSLSLSLCLLLSFPRPAGECGHRDGTQISHTLATTLNAHSTDSSTDGGQLASDGTVSQCSPSNLYIGHPTYVGQPISADHPTYAHLAQAAGTKLTV